MILEVNFMATISNIKVDITSLNEGVKLYYLN